MFVFQINKPPMQAPQMSDEQKIINMPPDNKELKKAAASSKPEIRKMATCEFASRLAAMPDKTSADFINGVNFLLNLAERAPEGDLRTVLCAAACAAAGGTMQMTAVQ